MSMMLADLVEFDGNLVLTADGPDPLGAAIADVCRGQPWPLEPAELWGSYGLEMQSVRDQVIEAALSYAVVDGQIDPNMTRADLAHSGELGPGWLERKRGHVKPSAFRSYENAWRVYVEPRWRAAKVGEIRHTGVQAWIAELSKDKSASRVITIYSVLAGILDDAVRNRMLAANPARGVSLPRRTRRPNVYLTAEQLHRLAVESGRYGSLILLLGVAGLR